MPYYAYLSVSNACNARCVFCNVYEKKDSNNVIDVPSLLYDLKDLGGKYIHFIGGEPFIEKRIIEYFQLATKLGFKSAATTNGYALTEDMIWELSQCSVNHLIVSLDSHLEEQHDFYRRKQGLWRRATDAIIKMKTISPQVTIIVNHLLHKNNINQFVNFLKLKKEVPFDYVNLIFIKDYTPLSINQEEYEGFCSNIDKYSDIAQEYDVKFMFDIKQINNLVQEKYNYRCLFPYYCLYVDCTTSTVYPCDCTVHRDACEYSVGRLLEQSLDSLWEGNRMEVLRHRLLFGEMSCKAQCDCSNLYTNQLLN